MGQQIISDEDHDCFGKLTNQFASEGSPIFLPNISVVYFQEQIGFVLKMIIFSYMAFASVRESVRTRDMGMACRHSSRITNLLGCVFILEHCTALRWRVAHLGRFHY